MEPPVRLFEFVQMAKDTPDGGLTQNDEWWYVGAACQEPDTYIHHGPQSKIMSVGFID